MAAAQVGDAGPSPDCTDGSARRLLVASQTSSTAKSSMIRNSTSSITSGATTATTTTVESPDVDAESGPPAETTKESPPRPEGQEQQQAAAQHEPSQPLAAPAGKQTSTTPTSKQTRHLLTLPPELLLMILTHLDFASFVHLRRTCHALRTLASPSQLRTLFGPMPFQTLVFASCRTCLTSDTTRANMVLASPSDPGYPLASQCITCALKDEDKRLVVDKRAPLANFEMADSCRWCGWPVLERGVVVTMTTRRMPEDFHAKCLAAYNWRLFWFFCMGWVQLSLGVTAAAMAWRWYRGERLVFGATVTTFLLLWVCIFSLILRSKESPRGIQFTMLVELAILALWIPPVYYLAGEFHRMIEEEEPIPRNAIATLTFFALNMLFRLLNVLGNCIVLGGYDMTRRHRPNPEIWRRMVHPILSRLVFWTYPQSLQRKPAVAR